MAGEIDPMPVVDDAIEDGVGIGRITDQGAALAVLMRKGVVRARRETVVAGHKPIEVYRVRITTVGRNALAAERS